MPWLEEGGLALAVPPGVWKHLWNTGPLRSNVRTSRVMHRMLILETYPGSNSSSTTYLWAIDYGHIF